MQRLKVSVIMPSYNSADYISGAIRSVIDQTYHNWELIVVDDASKDRSVEIVKAFQQNEPRIRLFINETNAGAAVTRNRCIEKSEGDIIAFLDSDDLWMKEKLEKQLAVYESNPAAAFVFTHYRHMDIHGNIFGNVVKASPEVSYKELLKGCNIGCLTVTYNVNLLGKRYFADYGHEDYILWLEILKEGYKAIGIPETLATYRITAGSLSANKLKAAIWQWNIYRKFEKLSVVKSLYYFIHYAVRAVRKHYS